MGVVTHTHECECCSPCTHRAGELLAAELKRVVICPPEEIGRDTVTMHSRIGYRFDLGENPDERVLVYPDQFTPAGPYVSILTPLGIALIGLRIGACMPFTDFDGNPYRIPVTEWFSGPKSRSTEPQFRSPARARCGHIPSSVRSARLLLIQQRLC